MTRIYNKTHKTAKERLRHLQSKGLMIKDVAAAEAEIEQIGYHRLRIYFECRRDRNTDERLFREDTKLQDIVRIYECDHKLRMACFSVLCRFETMLRNKMSEAISLQFGPHPYNRVDAFRDVRHQIEINDTLLTAFKNSKDQRAKHYKEHYDAPPLPPIWTVKEFLSFGKLPKIYQGLTSDLRTSLANSFGIPSDNIFHNWVTCLVDLRNACAHHDRVFNRSFQKQPQRLKKKNVPIISGAKLKQLLECLDYMMNSAGAGQGIVSKVEEVLIQYPEVNRHEAGYA